LARKALSLQLRYLILAATLSGAFTLAAPASVMASATTWDVNGCIQDNMQDPHISTGWGVLAKSQWECDNEPATIYLSYSGYTVGYWLWVCPTYPQYDENWLGGYCTFKGGTHQNMSFTSPNTVQTRYVPSNGQVTHGTGWWVACSEWFSIGAHGRGQTFLTFSNAVWLSY
jgi:hypothetical protein